MEKETIRVLEEIDQLKTEIDQLRPLDKTLEQKILQKFRLDWNYHSNHIEGNQLTFGETKSFLLHGITADGKPLKDHIDIKGHNEAILFLEDIIKEDRDITENFIRELHQMILHEPSFKNSKTLDGKIVKKKIEIGKYKSSQNHVETTTGEMFYFAEPEETPAKMTDLVDWYRSESNNKEIHPLIIAALFHYKFIIIHPFDDGNGRLARILMNLIIMKNGFPPVVIKTEKKEEYFQALQQADGGKQEFFINYIGRQLSYSLNLYLKGAKGEDIEEDDDIDKQIELLKKELEGKKEKIPQDLTTINFILNRVIIPIIDKAYLKLKQFDDLFFRKGYHYVVNGIGIDRHFDFEETLQEFENNFETIEQINNVTEFSFEWGDFKKTDLINIHIGINLIFDFKKYNSLECRSNPKTFNPIKIYYDNTEIPEKQINHIANSMAKYVLAEINNNLKEK